MCKMQNRSIFMFGFTLYVPTLLAYNPPLQSAQKTPTSFTIFYTSCYPGHCRNVPVFYPAILHMYYKASLAFSLSKIMYCWRA